MIWHLITSEYPPQPGGVSDYTHTVAEGLAVAGDEVHVWCPAVVGTPTRRGSGRVINHGDTESTDKSHKFISQQESREANGVVVHRELGRFAPADFRRVGSMLDRFRGPRRLLVQWVPHGYGYRSMNLPFCFWLWRRARFYHENIELMVHEPFLALGEGSLKQNLVAIVHRVMTVILLRAGRRVWISIPAWESFWRPYALGRSIEFKWLPVVSNIPVIEAPDSVAAIRARYTRDGGVIVGHFGTYDRQRIEMLLKSVPALMQNCAPQAMLLMGRGSEATRDELINRQPALIDRVHATGTLPSDELSLHVSACDMMFQPYIDGVSSRRTSTMVALAHGVPIVTTSGELTEPLWAETDAVALAPAEDLPALIEATQRLLPDTRSRKRMGAAARSLYAERFDTKHIIANLQAAT